MIIKTVFSHSGTYELGEVEIKLLPGLPQLHVVGLPDAGMRECGIKLKSAVRSSGFKWPRAQQIVVNLRPSHRRKQSSGVDLPIALGFLAQTGQLSPLIARRLEDSVAYGEVALDGRVNAPHDAAKALAAAGGRVFLTGESGGDSLRAGEWLEIGRLNSSDVVPRERTFDWGAHWRRPDLPDLFVHESAARALAVAVHLELSVLVAGPQGSGKTTWARALHALTPPPDLNRLRERALMFDDEPAWRPCEQPHHSTSREAMIGGGNPVRPGIISRSHGGVLIMDEFLEFQPYVLEALRQPLENGTIEIARQGARARWPAKFQLIATTNLCPCGKLNPTEVKGCNHSLTRCRSVCFRLSGPLLDRFDILVFSHEWLERGARRVALGEVAQTIDVMREFASHRRETGPPHHPDWLGQLELSHRRTYCVPRVARALADLEGSSQIREDHIQGAAEMVIAPMAALQRVFG